MPTVLDQKMHACFMSENFNIYSMFLVVNLLCLDCSNKNVNMSIFFFLVGKCNVWSWVRKKTTEQGQFSS